jgi:hypothetical protein
MSENKNTKRSLFSWRNIQQYRKLNKLVTSLTTDERIALNAYFMSGSGPLEPGVNLNDIVEYLATLNIEEVKKVINEAKLWADKQDNLANSLSHTDSNIRRQINFTLNATDQLDPTSVIVLSRDIGDADRLTLQEINVDTGDYIPIPTAAVVDILRNYADSIEERQAEINRSAENW